MLNLVQFDNGVFDLVFADPVQTDTDTAVATLIYTVLFTDAEAPINRAPDRFTRRGWWANADAGCGIWHVRRQGLSPAARREALNMVQQALQSHSPALSDVVVTERLAPPGSVSSLFIDIAGLHNGTKFLFSTAL